MIYDYIREIIIAGGPLTGVDDINKQVFVYEMPAAVPVGILITPIPEAFYVSDYLPKYYRGDFLVVVRAKSISAAQTIANELLPILAVKGQANADYEIKFMKPLSLPHQFPRSEGDLYEFLVPCEIAFAELN